MGLLDGHVAVVTGGGSGIGKAIAQALADAGACVAVMDVDVDAAHLVANEIGEASGKRCKGFEGDVSDQAAVVRAASLIDAELGTPSILVNNAGFMAPRLVATEALTETEFDRMFAVHVRGTFLMVSAVLPAMKARRFGRIVNLSSILGLVGFPFRTAYSTAKSAIVGFTRGLAIETARFGITVNAIAPGYVLTEALRARIESGLLDHDVFAERTPVGRWAQPAEIARVACFLAEPASSYITGTTIPVDGGFAIRGDPNEFIGATS
jgi:NAD(P)-dependent dehydrogenase (short-subunit alcohol dehydrogenase family)